MFYNDIKEKLNKLKQSDQLNPDEDWKQENKEALLSEIEQDTQQEESANLLEKAVSLCDVLFPRRMVMAGKMTVFIFFIVFAAIGGWSVTVQASYSSVPGDTLYNIKLAAEQAELTVTKVVGSEADKAKLHSEFATRRAEEAKKIITNKKQPKQAKETIERMNASLDRAQNSLRRADRKVRSTQEVLNNNKLIQDTLSKTLVDSYEGSLGLADDIIVVKGEITEGSLSILEYMVRSRLKEDVDLSKEETRALVVETISALSNSDVKSDVDTDVLDDSAVEKIASGVVSNVEKKNGSEIDSGLKRRPMPMLEQNKEEQQSNKEEQKKEEQKSEKNNKDQKNEEGDAKEKTQDQSDEKDKEKESNKDNKEDAETEAKEESTESATGTEKTSLSASSSKKSIELAEKLAQEGNLLEAIQTAQEVSSNKQKELLKLVGSSEVEKQKKENGEVLVEFDNEDDETITTTIQSSTDFASGTETSTASSTEDEATTTEKGQDTETDGERNQDKQEDDNKKEESQDEEGKDKEEKSQTNNE